MKTLLILLLVILASTAMADPYKVQGIPCDGTMNGEKLIISRPPTTEEIAAVLPGLPGFQQQPLLMVYDHITCDGKVWSLDQMVKQYRGEPGTLMPRIEVTKVGGR